MTLDDITKNYIDRPALAKALKCSERTIARYEKRGLLSLMIGGRKFYSLSAVSDFLKRREKESRK